MVFSELPRGSYCLFRVLWSLGLVFVLDDASEEDLAKDKGPLRPKQELEQRSSLEGHASGLGKGEGCQGWQPLVGSPATPQCSLVLTTCWRLSKVNRSKLTSQPLQSSAGILTCPLGLDFCFKYLRFFLSPSTGVSAPRTAPCIWDAIHHFLQAPTRPQLSLQSLDHNSSLTWLPQLPPWLLLRSQGNF